MCVCECVREREREREGVFDSKYMYSIVVILSEKKKQCGTCGMLKVCTCKVKQKSILILM